jgi:hypothetical protein
MQVLFQVCITVYSRVRFISRIYIWRMKGHCVCTGGGLAQLFFTLTGPNFSAATSKFERLGNDTHVIASLLLCCLQTKTDLRTLLRQSVVWLVASRWNPIFSRNWITVCTFKWLSVCFDIFDGNMTYLHISNQNNYLWLSKGTDTVLHTYM